MQQLAREQVVGARLPVLDSLSRLSQYVSAGGVATGLGWVRGLRDLLGSRGRLLSTCGEGKASTYRSQETKCTEQGLFRHDVITPLLRSHIGWFFTLLEQTSYDASEAPWGYRLSSVLLVSFA